MASKKGVQKHIGNGEQKGVFIVRCGGKHYKVMLLNDYLKTTSKDEGESKFLSRYHFFKNASKDGINQLAKVNGRNRFCYFVCIEGGSIPQFISDENGVFDVMVGNRWQKCQFIEQYRQQHEIKSKALVQHKLYNGVDGLEQVVLHRYDAAQNITLVGLPKTKI